MTPAAVSVIVVSRGRSDALMRCLTGLEQLDHPNFEIVVVADPAGIAAVEGSRFSGRIKLVPFDAANISQARNEGLRQAAGDVVAFIDDDAVPEPTWLTHLAMPFAEGQVAAAGGFVRGRNGISFQNKARRVDVFGDHADLAMPDDRPQVFAGAPGQAIKTEGTNCAFRRSILAGLGGFDPAFAFYLDETDVNLRLAAAGHRTAMVPLAQVHHGFAPSAHRLGNRMPRSLFDVGASQSVLLRKHAPGTDPAPVLARLRVGQRARLLRHMVAGTCEPGDVARVMATLEAGIAAGGIRGFGSLPPIGPSLADFQTFRPDKPFSGACWLGGRPWQSEALRKEAARQVARGQRVSLFFFSPTALYHRVSFHPAGYWEQRGGLWGRSDRADRLVQRFGFRDRLRHEIARVGLTRNIAISQELCVNLK